MSPILPLALWQDAPAGAPQGPTGFVESLLSGMFVPLALCFLVFWFLILRPESKQRKRRKEMLEAMKKGDRVVTNSGLFGTVVQVQENVVTLQVDEGVRLRFSTSAIQTVLDEDGKEPDLAKK